MLHTMNILLIKKSLVLRKAGLFFHIANFSEGRFSTFGRNIQSSITFQLHCRSEHYYFSFYSYRFLCIYFTFDYLEKRFFYFPLVFLFIIYSWYLDANSNTEIIIYILIKTNWVMHIFVVDIIEKKKQKGFLTDISSVLQFHFLQLKWKSRFKYT